jgi:two-component system CheB/CheR fusion protein
MLSKKTPPNGTLPFPVVGVGGSAGDPDAFGRFVYSINPLSGMAYVLVQHFEPGTKSVLHKVVSGQTTLPIVVAKDGMAPQPDTIYIAPEFTSVTFSENKLKLVAVKGKLANKPVDMFFRSLGDEYQSFARGVILSGTGYDGTEGLKIIKEQGGSTFAQAPDDAVHEDMPLSAIRAGAADFVLRAADIPEQLKNIADAYEHNGAYPDIAEAFQLEEDELYKHIVGLLQKRTGHDFSHYKQPTIRRRIARRMVICNSEDMAAYLALLEKNKKEQEALFNDILIPVSYFFRDHQNFKSLLSEVFPHIAKDKTANDGIRIWVAGCSTGEEAYSIAICAREFFSDTLPGIKIQIFASDISEKAITKARAAVYTNADVQNVSPERLESCFTKVDGEYHVKKEIREICIFAVHNFIKDPPFAKMDLISCRNVMIYMDRFLQKKALTTFHYALSPHGALFIGKSETVNNVPNLFMPFVKTQKIYLRKNTKDKTAAITYAQQDRNDPRLRQSPGKKADLPDTSTIHKKVNDLLFTRYTPASLVLDDTREIIHFHGDVSPYLLPSPGKPNFNIFKMLHEDLAFEVRAALLMVKGGNKSIVKENLPVKGRDFTVNLEVISLEDNGNEHYLLLFHKNMIPAETVEAAHRNSADQERIRQLEAELQQTRDDIRKVTEDQEVAYEELQSANEELLSNGEELQTLNEELETAAEELRSNNEELNGVNEELKDRQKQLTLSRLYLESIVDTIREPLLVLDGDFRVKSANSSYYRYFHTTEQQTAGKVIFDLSEGNWDNPHFRDELDKVRSSKEKVENFELEILLPEGEKVMLLNVRPILNESLGEQLILIAINDMTELRTVNRLLETNILALEESNRELSSFNYIVSHDLQEPLRKINLFCKLISQDSESSLSVESAEQMDRMTLSIKRMQRLIEDLLSYSHIDNSKNYQLFDTDINVIVRESMEDLSEIITAKSAVVTTSTFRIIRAMPVLLRQLFTNLIGNAVKYSVAGIKPSVSIEGAEATREEIAIIGGSHSNYYKLTVKDNGIGFPSDQSSRIFEPFHRLHSKDKFEGSGIGLAICKKIMVKHHGFITSESAPGNGAAFMLFFPV